MMWRFENSHYYPESNVKVGKLGGTEREHDRKHVLTRSFDSRGLPAVSDLQLNDALFC